jgi:hypothetical protein
MNNEPEKATESINYDLLADREYIHTLKNKATKEELDSIDRSHFSTDQGYLEFIRNYEFAKLLK